MRVRCVRIISRRTPDGRSTSHRWHRPVKITNCLCELRMDGRMWFRCDVWMSAYPTTVYLMPLQRVLSACVAAPKCRPVLHFSVVIMCGSSGSGGFQLCMQIPSSTPPPLSLSPSTLLFLPPSPSLSMTLTCPWLSASTLRWSLHLWALRRDIKLSNCVLGLKGRNTIDGTSTEEVDVPGYCYPP